jgi:hypothetical protein
MITIINKKANREIVQSKMDGYLKFCELIRWGRNNPSKFAEFMYGIEFMDYQKYCFDASFNKRNVLWLCSRNAGKSTLTAPFAMTKMMLYPNFQTYILSLTASQSQDTFLKMEKIAKKQLNSFAGLTDVFLGEVVQSANSDGFIHAPSGFRFKLYNDSEVHTVSGDEKTAKGKRSNLNIYDESGWLSEEYIVDTSAFTTQDSSFALGEGVDTEIIPENIPNQILLCSSASDIDSEFYRLYKEYTKKMIAYGSTSDYFTANVDCEVVINATLGGRKLVTPLLSKAKVESDISTNPSKFTREYYNHFDKDGGDKAPIKRVDILRNSHIYVPELINTDLSRKRYYGISYDPAHNFDNSIISVGEYYKDDKGEWRLKLINCINLTDIEKKKKTPMKQPEQIDKLKETILNYNGEGEADYSNIECVIIDSGSGGGGNTVPDYFYEDWKGIDGKMHKGLVDIDSKPEDSQKYPDAIDKLRLIEPRKYRNTIFDDFINMLLLGVIEFPAEYDNKPYLMLPIEGDDIEEVDEETSEVKKVKSIQYKRYNLSFDEQLALTQLEMAKEELIAVRSTGKSGNTSYLLPSDIVGCKLKDDRAYSIALLAHHLVELRRENITNKKVKQESMLDYCFF